LRSRLARWFPNLSLAWKLTVLATATSAVSITLACALLAWYDTSRLTTALIADTEILVDGLAASNTATILFGDVPGTTETLRAAGVNEQILVAAILKRDGEIFARYDRNLAARATPLSIDMDALRRGRGASKLADGRLVMSRVVRLDDDTIGFAYVELGLKRLDAQLGALRLALVLALLGTVSLAMLIGWRLQRIVSDPLLQLITVTRNVARDRDYALRAQRMADDEVGELVTGFNEMLAHIQERDVRLEAHRTELERTVTERTAELQATMERFRLLVESTNAVPWEITYPAWTFSYISPQAATLFGFESVELVQGMGLLDLVHPDDQVRVRQSFTTLVEEGGTKGFDIEYRVVTSGGTFVDVRSVGAAPAQADGSQTVLRGLTIDMTQQKKLEMEQRQAQKLESVGRLAAGVAHEINTPVQFVSDSVHFVRTSMADLATMIAVYQTLHASVVEGTPSLEAAEKVTRAVEDADLDYVLENVPKALDRALDGLDRVSVIVRSMKEFAHPDHTEAGPADLNQAIRSTLTIARNEYKYIADVETDFADLPAVTCHLGDINQVVLNLIVNASHAIQDVVHGTERRGLITIRTRCDEASAIIEISDTGGGIPTAIRERIFDPFFTTKGVGKGTGQGLAIARTVVREKHGGALTFETELGTGTTFTIRLPIDGTSTQPAAA